MAHFAKYNKGAMGHMLQHYDRSKENLGNNVIRDRTNMNYNLAEFSQPLKQLEFVHKRLGEVKVQNRKDVNVLCDWVITVPKDLPEKEHRAFFQASYAFLSEKYGRQNVVSAWIHLDETTPHMHFAFIPVVHDKKKNGRYKVSAKEAVTLQDLKIFHQDLQKYVECFLGHKVGILNDATKDGNKSIVELKRKSATKRLQEVNEQVQKASVEASKIVSKAVFEAKGINDRLAAVKAEYEAIKEKKQSLLNHVNVLEEKKQSLQNETERLKEKYKELESRPPVQRILEVEQIVEVEKNYKTMAEKALNAFRIQSEWIDKKGLSAESYTDLCHELDYLQTNKTVYPKNKARVAPLYPDSAKEVLVKKNSRNI